MQGNPLNNKSETGALSSYVEGVFVFFILGWQKTPTSECERK